MNRQPNEKLKNAPGDEKILLVLLPFWDPQIPPLGISCLKGFLQRQGYAVKSVDANTEEEFRGIYHCYFNILKKYIPGPQQGNLPNLGNIVLEKHLMAHINHTAAAQYIELIKIIINDHFLCLFQDDWVRELNVLLEDFCKYLDHYISSLLYREQPSILGVSVFSGTLPASIRTVKQAKKKYPHIKTVLGGGVFSDQLAVDSPDMDYFLRETGDYIDHIIIGEGEKLFLKLLRGQLPESRKIYTLANQTVEPMDIGGENIPDFSDFDLNFYPHLGGYGSRGCPFQCKFCSDTVNWGRYRKKKAAQVVEELAGLSQRYDYQLFLLSDFLLNPIITDLSVKMAETGMSIYWDGFLRADKSVCDIDSSLQWRRGGFYRARLGLESGSPGILKKMNKEIDIEQIKGAIYSLAYAGIKTTTYWVIGYPGETGQDFQQTLDLLEQMKDNIYEAECNPFILLSNARVFSDSQLNDKKKMLLYPQWSRPLLLCQTYCLDCEPSRLETMKRVQRFVQHCKKLGIPNPYSLEDIFQADERWKRLHKNAVPPLVEFKDKKNPIDENKYVKKLSFATSPTPDESDWL